VQTAGQVFSLGGRHGGQIGPLDVLQFGDSGPSPLTCRICTEIPAGPPICPSIGHVRWLHGAPAGGSERLRCRSLPWAFMPLGLPRQVVSFAVLSCAMPLPKTRLYELLIT
jgi:hypothetical protein